MKKVNTLRLSAFVYTIIFLAALWVVAFSITGNVLRSFMFIGAVVLAGVAYSQSSRLAHSADVIEMEPFWKEFEKEMKDK